KVVITNVNTAKQHVTAIFPVTFNPCGVKPNKFNKKIKKNTDNKYGINFLYFFSPILGLAISSRTYITIGSKAGTIPFGRLFGHYLYAFANAVSTKNTKIVANINQ